MKDNLPETQEEYEDVIYEELDKARSAMSNVMCLIHEIKEKDWGIPICDLIGHDAEDADEITDRMYGQFYDKFYTEEEEP